MGFVLQELHRWLAHRLRDASEFSLVLAIFVAVAALVAFPRTRLWLRVPIGAVVAVCLALLRRKGKVT